MARVTILHRNSTRDRALSLVTRAVTIVIKRNFSPKEICFVEKGSLDEKSATPIIVTVKTEAPDADYDADLRTALEQEAELAIREELPAWLKPEGTTMIHVDIVELSGEEELLKS